MLTYSFENTGSAPMYEHLARCIKYVCVNRTQAYSRFPTVKALQNLSSAIIDVVVDQGGHCKTTKVTAHDNTIYVVDVVVHYCARNIPGASLRISTIAFTHAILSIVADSRSRS